MRPAAPARAARIAARPASTARPSALRPSRWPAAIIGLVVLVATAWGFAASAYLIMRGDAVVEVKQERAAMQTAYEERISQLRSEVDAVNSRLMLDQDAFEAKLEALRQRQALLEQRQTELATLVDGARHPALKAIAGLIATEATGSLTVVHEGAEAEEAQKAREIRLSFPTRGGPAETGTEPAAARNPAEHALNRLSQSQDRMEASQRAILEGIEAGATLVSRHIEEAIADLGFDAEKVASRPISSAPALAAASSLGGPFIPTPLNGPDAKSPFERQVASARESIARSIGLYDGLMALPVRRPLTEKRDVTSNFGIRRDPFEGRMAMHAGIDFRAGRGTPVRAPAAGVVTLAGRNAGYGKMIEIEHKNGVSTRYGHLSAISVAKGQRVKAGEIIGRVGSTGRSTGPHLHYETRIKGEPTDPRRFLEIADRLQVSIAAH